VPKKKYLTHKKAK